MLFYQFQHPEGACLSYLIGCTKTGVAAIFEPQLNIQPYLDLLKAKELKLTHIVETHAHADHISGAKQLSEATGAPVYFHESANAGYPIQRLRHGQELFVGNIKLKILHTPGHTTDSISIVVSDTTRSDEPWFVFTGDTLFVGDVGRPDLDGDPSSLYDSVFGTLMGLPDGVEMFPTHYAGSTCGKAMSPKPSSTIGFERRFSPALHFDSREEFVAFVNNDLPIQPPRFRQVREYNMGFLAEPPIEKTLTVQELEISVEGLKGLLDSGGKPFLLDVRNPDEVRKATIGGTLIPLRELPGRVGEIDRNADIIVYCHHGSRSEYAAEILRDAGFSRVRNLSGGINAWSLKVDSGVPRY